MDSPLASPIKTATNGMKYVTVLETTGPESCTNLLNKIKLIAVPNSDNAETAATEDHN